MAPPKRPAHLGLAGRPGLVESDPVGEGGIVLEGLADRVLEVAPVPEAAVAGRVGDMGRVAEAVPSVLSILKP